MEVENKMILRDKFAAAVMTGIVSADWKLPTDENTTWDQIAVRRAFEIADLMVKERDITTVT